MPLSILLKEVIFCSRIHKTILLCQVANIRLRCDNPATTAEIKEKWCFMNPVFAEYLLVCSSALCADLWMHRQPCLSDILISGHNSVSCLEMTWMSYKLKHINQCFCSHKHFLDIDLHCGLLLTIIDVLYIYNFNYVDRSAPQSS